MKRIERMQENGRRLEGKFIIGIDLAKSKHQAALLNLEGTTAGRGFSFAASHTGFAETLSGDPQVRRGGATPEDEVRRFSGAQLR